MFCSPFHYCCRIQSHLDYVHHLFPQCFEEVLTLCCKKMKKGHEDFLILIVELTKCYFYFRVQSYAKLLSDCPSKTQSLEFYLFIWRFIASFMLNTIDWSTLTMSKGFGCSLEMKVILYLNNLVKIPGDSAVSVLSRCEVRPCSKRINFDKGCCDVTILRFYSVIPSFRKWFTYDWI